MQLGKGWPTPKGQPSLTQEALQALRPGSEIEPGKRAFERVWVLVVGRHTNPLPGPRLFGAKLSCGFLFWFTENTLVMILAPRTTVCVFAAECGISRWLAVDPFTAIA